MRQAMFRDLQLLWLHIHVLGYQNIKWMGKDHPEIMLIVPNVLRFPLWKKYTERAAQ